MQNHKTLQGTYIHRFVDSGGNLAPTPWMFTVGSLQNLFYLEQKTVMKHNENNENVMLRTESHSKAQLNQRSDVL